MALVLQPSGTKAAKTPKAEKIEAAVPSPAQRVLRKLDGQNLHSMPGHHTL